MLSSSGSLEAVVDQLTRFRSRVRAFALARQDAPATGLHPERIPLLEACDALRDDLAPFGVVIKVRRAANEASRSYRPD